MAIGIKLNGNKEVLGMWIGGNESAKYWLGVLKYSHAVAFLTAFTVFSHSSSIVKFLILLINVAIFFPIGFIQCSPTVSRPIMQSKAFKTGAAVQSTSCPSMASFFKFVISIPQGDNLCGNVRIRMNPVIFFVFFFYLFPSLFPFFFRLA